MSRRVLNVGQCVPDHTRISQTLQQYFEVEIDCADTLEEAIQRTHESSYDLVLVNRLFDRDGTPGMDFVRQLKSNSATSEMPIMLVSNFAEAQQEAVEAGAVEGFGKAALSDEKTISILGAFLK